MDQRNWLQLSRKLVDRYDLDYTIDGMTDALLEVNNAIFGEGVVVTSQFPNPFPITLSGSFLGGTVGFGSGYDVLGNFTSINSNTTSSNAFHDPTADNTHPRWDLLVIQYTQVGDTLVPQPSDPLTTIDLNLHDDFTLFIRPGTPSVSPSYPAKQTNDIILAGIQVPNGATLGTMCTLDLSIREFGLTQMVQLPVFVQEVLTGTVNGSNTAFTLSQMPLNGYSALIYLDSEIQVLSAEYTLVGQTVTFAVAPQPGQVPYAYYVVASPSSINPLSLMQEQGVGVSDGSNPTFNLSGRPANQVTTMVFVDGLIEDSSHWYLHQNATMSSIVFGGPYVPQEGQNVYVAYLVNPATVGIFNQGGGGGGGGSGAYTVYGSIISPLVTSAGAGIAATTDQRQLQFVESPGGPTTITANPQISPGTIVGQEMLLQGTSTTNTLIFNDGNGLSLNGAVSLGGPDYEVICLFWNGSVWSEMYRR